jgi:hypothetical protein
MLRGELLLEPRSAETLAQVWVLIQVVMIIFLSSVTTAMRLTLHYPALSRRLGMWVLAHSALSTLRFNNGSKGWRLHAEVSTDFCASQALVGG